MPTQPSPPNRGPCDAIYAALLKANETDPAAGAADSSATQSTPTESVSPSEDPEEDPTQFAAFTVDDITIDQIKACGEARTAQLTANAVLADYYHQLVTTGTIVTPDESSGPAPTASASPSASASPTSGTAGSSGSAPSGSSSGSSTSSTASVSARAVAAATADVLSAEQDAAAAESNLESAELLAPIDGTVGALSLDKGASASGAR